MTIVLSICLTMLGAAALLTVYRMTQGPTMLDRAIAMDVLVAIVFCGMVIDAATYRRVSTLPILVVLALLGFVGSVSVARFASRDVPARPQKRKSR